MNDYDKKYKTTKSLGRDANVIIKIVENVNNIRGFILQSKCDFSNTPKGLANNVYSFDLCAFYMAQIGEKVKLLTDATIDDLSKVVNLRACIKFRNLIDHDYENLNRAVLVPYIQLVASNEFLKALQDRYKYCLSNKRKNN